MILHIVRKDLRLLWPLVLILSALQVIEAVAVYRLGPFMEPRGLLPLVYLLPLVIILGLAALSTLAVQQEPLPDGPQDWLVRPIRRRDLLLAKLLFVLLFGLGPLWLADTLLGVAAGFPLSAATVASAARALSLACLFTLPALCIAAITRGLVQAVMAALGVLVTFLAGWSVLMLLGLRPTLGGASLLWLLLGAWQGLAVVAALSVLGLQYLRRHTITARRVAAAYAVMAFLGPLLFTWRGGFNLQSAIASESATVADPLVLAFDGTRPRFHLDQPLPGVLNPGGNVGLSRMPGVIYLPLSAAGRPEQSLVLSNRTELRIADAVSGAELYSGPPNMSVDGVGSFPMTRLVLEGEPGVRAWQPVYLPASVYRRIKDRPVRVQLRWYLTLLRPTLPVSLPALDAEQPLSGLGRCASRVDDEGDGVLVGCRTLDGRAAGCFRAWLEQPATGARNPAVVRCDPDYSPWPDNLWPTALANVAMELPFRDLNGLARYPVGGTALGSARVMIQTWQPRAHFERALTIASLRLSDWEVQP